MATKKPIVFVYGTLKAGRTNHGALEGAEYIGRATIEGPYAFVDLGWYPAVIPVNGRENRQVGGELWRVNDDILRTLDMIEGHPTYYKRSKVDTSYGRKAWVYFLSEDLKPWPIVKTLFWEENEAELAWQNAA